MSEQDLQSQIIGLQETMRRHTHDGLETQPIALSSTTTPGIVRNVTNDTNITGSISGSTLALGYTGQLAVNRGGTGRATLTAHEVLLGNGTGNVTLITNSTAGFVLTSNGNADPSFQSAGTVSQTSISVLAGEHITAGEVVRIYDSSVEHGYGQTTSPATPYIARAAATSATFTPNVLGIALENINYLSTGSILVAGVSTVQSGLGFGKNFLADYSAASTETITQSSHALSADYSDTVSVTQIWIPTQSFLHKVSFYMGFGVGATPVLKVKRASTVLATISTYTNVGSVYTFDCGGIQTYKGEMLTFNINHAGTPGDKGQVYYQTGDPYAPTYDPTGSSASIDATGGVSPNNLPASGADLYMSVFEYTNFGKLSTTPGTRKIKIGNALTATSLALAVQEGDSIL